MGLLVIRFRLGIASVVFTLFPLFSSSPFSCLPQTNCAPIIARGLSLSEPDTVNGTITFLPNLHSKRESLMKNKCTLYMTFPDLKLWRANRGDSCQWVIVQRPRTPQQSLETWIFVGSDRLKSYSAREGKLLMNGDDAGLPLELSELETSDGAVIWVTVDIEANDKSSQPIRGYSDRTLHNAETPHQPHPYQVDYELYPCLPLERLMEKTQEPEQRDLLNLLGIRDPINTTLGNPTSTGEIRQRIRRRFRRNATEEEREEEEESEKEGGGVEGEEGDGIEEPGDVIPWILWTGLLGLLLLGSLIAILISTYCLCLLRGLADVKSDAEAGDIATQKTQTGSGKGSKRRAQSYDTFSIQPSTIGTTPQNSPADKTYENQFSCNDIPQRSVLHTIPTEEPEVKKQNMILDPQKTKKPKVIAKAIASLVQQPKKKEEKRSERSGDQLAKSSLTHDAIESPSTKPSPSPSRKIVSIHVQAGSVHEVEGGKRKKGSGSKIKTLNRVGRKGSGSERKKGTKRTGSNEMTTPKSGMKGKDSATTLSSWSPEY